MDSFSIHQFVASPLHSVGSNERHHASSLRRILKNLQVCMTPVSHERHFLAGVQVFPGMISRDAISFSDALDATACIGLIYEARKTV